MEFVSEIPPSMELVIALEHATLMVKQLPSTTDPSQILQVRSSFQNAHQQLGSFLARFESPPQPHVGGNSVSCAVGDDEPMELGDDENSKIIIDKVEERMRDCVLQNKRRKRPPSPSSIAATERRASSDIDSVPELPVFDPHGTRLRSLDLVFQFHG